MAVNASVVDLDDARRHAVEEIAVVRDEKQRSFEFAQENLQPLDRFGVEMVRRLVQQQQIRLRHQGARQRHATFFTTGQIAHAAIRRRHAEFVHRRRDAGLDAPTIVQLDQMQQFGLLIALHRAGFVFRD